MIQMLHVYLVVKDKNNKWRANKLILGKKRNLADVSTFEYLITLGAKICMDDDDDFVIGWASENNHSHVIKFLMKHGANIDINNNFIVK